MRQDHKARVHRHWIRQHPLPPRSHRRLLVLLTAAVFARQDYCQLRRLNSPCHPLPDDCLQP